MLERAQSAIYLTVDEKTDLSTKTAKRPAQRVNGYVQNGGGNSG
jgi:hypothetical protein